MSENTDFSQLERLAKIQLLSSKSQLSVTRDLNVSFKEFGIQMNALYIVADTTVKAFDALGIGLINIAEAFAETAEQGTILMDAQAGMIARYDILGNAVEDAFNELESRNITTQQQQKQTGKGTINISENPIQKMIKNTFKWEKTRKWAESKQNKRTKAMIRTTKIFGKQAKKSGKKMAEMTWQMAMLNTVAGPFLGFLDGVMKPFSSLTSTMEAAGQILGLAFVPAINEMNQRIISSFPALMEFSLGIQDVASDATLAVSPMSWVSLAFEAIGTDAEAAELAVVHFNDGISTLTAKYLTLRDNIHTAIDSIDWAKTADSITGPMVTAFKFSISAIQWATEWSDMTSAEKVGSMVQVLGSLVDSIEWDKVFELVPGAMGDGLLTAFGLETVDYGGIVLNMTNGIEDELLSSSYSGIASNILGGIKKEIIKNPLKITGSEVLSISLL